LKRNTNIKNERLAYNLVSLFLFVIANCIFIKFSHRYGTIGTISFIVYFILVTVIIGFFDITKSKTNNRKKELFSFLLSIPLLVFFIWLSIFELKPKYNSWQLKKHGVQVLAKITRHDERRTKGTIIKLSIFEYQYNNQNYLQQTADPMDYYLLDDQIILNVSKKDPEIFEIIGKSYNEVK